MGRPLPLAPSASRFSVAAVNGRDQQQINDVPRTVGLGNDDAPAARKLGQKLGVRHPYRASISQMKGEGLNRATLVGCAKLIDGHRLMFTPARIMAGLYPYEGKSETRASSTKPHRTLGGARCRLHWSMRRLCGNGVTDRLGRKCRRAVARNPPAYAFPGRHTGSCVSRCDGSNHRVMVMRCCV